MAHQIDLFCVHQLADTGCIEGDHNGYLRACAAAPVTDRNPAGAVRREACCSGQISPTGPLSAAYR